MAGRWIPCRTAPDIRAPRRARAKRDMDVKIVRVVMNPAGVAYRVRRMKPLVELAHDLLRRGLQHVVGTDSRIDQLVVHLARHGEDETMLNDRIFREGWIFPNVLEPRLGDSSLSFVVRHFGRRGPAAVFADQDQVVQESPRVNLPKRFL